MDSESRSALIVMLWFASGITIAAIFIAAAVMNAFTLWHALFGFVILGLAVVGTPFLLNFKPEDELEKAKRQRIDNLLRDLSDDDLVALKQRLSDGDVSEDTILDFIGDDGELVTRS